MSPNPPSGASSRRASAPDGADASSSRNPLRPHPPAPTSREPPRWRAPVRRRRRTRSPTVTERVSSVGRSSSSSSVGRSSSPSSSSSSSMMASASSGSRASSAAARVASRYCAGSMVTRRGGCAVNMEPGEGATAGEALKSAPRPPEGERAALEGAALAGVPSGMKSERWRRAPGRPRRRGSDARADDGSAARASSDSNGTSGLSLTPNAANGSVFW